MTTAVEAKAIIKKGSSHRRAPLPTAPPPVHRDLSRARHPGASFKFSGSRMPSLTHPAAECGEGPFSACGMVPVWKRALDLSCILISLPVTVPVMAAVALWIKFASRGPALFRQERIGLNGKRFVLYKFRSMKPHADTRRHESYFRQLVRSDSPMVKLDLMCDSRLLPGGCFLRAAGLDELPQLLNILRGEMSLVGPRPCLSEEFGFFSPKQRQRFQALPGLTGVWQVCGKGEATFSEMNAMDALYVRRASPALDLSIMMRTPVALLRQMYAAFLQPHGRAAAPSDCDESEATPVSGFCPQRLG